MSTTVAEWYLLTPAGVLHAFADKEPAPRELALQSLLSGERTLPAQTWCEQSEAAKAVQSQALTQGWIQVLPRPLQRPSAKLDDLLQHVIASLSGERRAVLASEGGFCLAHAGMTQDEAETLSAAAADYSSFATRQSRRGWQGAMRYVSFHSDPELLLPSTSFLPFWVDGAGYWLVVAGEPLLNNPALVELVWVIKEAGTRFTIPDGF